VSVTNENLKYKVYELAAGQGFDLCRVTRPQLREPHLAGLEQWIGQGMQGDMAWMAEHERLARRRNPSGMLEGVKSVITVAMRYAPPSYSLHEACKATSRGAISAYAHGVDYHDVMKPRLKALARELDVLLGIHDQRVYVDTAPVLEHALAEGAGLGWQGKHSLTLNRELGSWFLLGELFTTADIAPDQAASFHCGTCTACIDICPTRAIVAPFVVDARLCISYLTIEYKGIVLRDLRPLFGNRIYGCDDCQMLCPWNKDMQPPESDFLAPRGENCLPELASLLLLDDAAFRSRFAKSPVKRLGRERLVRNCCIAAGNSADAALLPTLWQLAQDESALIRAHAIWAIGRLSAAGGDTRTVQSRLEAILASEVSREVCEELDLTIKEIKEKT